MRDTGDTEIDASVKGKDAGRREKRGRGEGGDGKSVRLGEGGKEGGKKPGEAQQGTQDTAGREGTDDGWKGSGRVTGTRGGRTWRPDGGRGPQDRVAEAERLR